jgi:hypothetical protein
MPDVTVVDILEKIEDTIEALDGIVDDQVKLGIMWPADGAEHATYINVVPVRKHSVEIDGYEVHATFEVLVACVTRIDSSSANAQFKQLNTTWSAIEKAMENLMKNNCDSLADKMTMDPSGVDWAGFDDKSEHAFAAAVYIVEIEHTLGTA